MRWRTTSEPGTAPPGRQKRRARLALAWMLGVLLTTDVIAAETVRDQVTTGAGEPRFVPRQAAVVAQRDNVELVSVLTSGGAAFPGTTFTVLREEPDAFGKTRHTVMATSGAQATASFRLSPGRYRIQARNGAVQHDERIEVPQHGVFRHEVVLDAGELQLDALLDDSGQEAAETWFRVLRQDTDAYGRPIRTQVAGDGYAASAGFLLPAGDYLVEATCGNATRETPVRIVAGRQIRQTLVLHAGRLALSAALVDGGEPAAQTVFRIYRREQDGRGQPQWTPLAESDPTGEIAFVLPAGEYLARAELGHASSALPLTLAAGERRDLELVLDAGELNLLTTLEGDPRPLPNARFSVSPAAPTGREASDDTTLLGPGHRAYFTLPAGRYLASARVGESEHSVPVEVVAGAQQTAVIPQHAGRVTLALVEAQGEDPYASSWFSVYRLKRDARGNPRHRRVFNEGYFAATDLILPAGDYVAFARHGMRRGERRFAVLPGEVKSLAIEAGR